MRRAGVEMIGACGKGETAGVMKYLVEGLVVHLVSFDVFLLFFEMGCEKDVSRDSAGRLVDERLGSIA